jgi:hypothetical protein
LHPGQQVVGLDGLSEPLFAVLDTVVGRSAAVPSLDVGFAVAVGIAASLARGRR